MSRHAPARLFEEIAGGGEAHAAPFLAGPGVGVRKAAIRAVAVLDGDNYTEKFLALLASEHPGLSKAAAHAPRGRYALVADQLRALFSPGEAAHAHVRRHVFRLLSAQSFWARGAFLLEAMRDGDTRIVALARQGLAKWRVRSGGMAPGLKARPVTAWGEAPGRRPTEDFSP